jgi:hypothetical protein
VLRCIHVLHAGGFLSLAPTNVAGQGAIKLVELRSSPSGVQYTRTCCSLAVIDLLVLVATCAPAAASSQAHCVDISL